MAGLYTAGPWKDPGGKLDEVVHLVEWPVVLEGRFDAGYLELRIVTSYHAAAGGRPAGGYVLSYQLVPPGGKPRRVANGIRGTITIPVKPNTVPLADVEAI